MPILGDIDVGSAPLWLLLAAFVLLTAGSALIMRASSINSSALQQTIVDDLRQEAFEAILQARWTFVLQRRRSDIIEVVTTGAARSGQAYQLMQLSVTGDPVRGHRRGNPCWSPPRWARWRSSAW